MNISIENQFPTDEKSVFVINTTISFIKTYKNELPLMAIYNDLVEYLERHTKYLTNSKIIMGCTGSHMWVSDQTTSNRILHIA